MYQIITCSGCGKAGVFDIKVEFTYKRDPCKSCAHDYSHPWYYYFCTLPCMMAWQDSIYLKMAGFPCQSCHGTGCAYGIKSNPPCDECKGTKAVLGRSSHEDPFDKFKPMIANP